MGPNHTFRPTSAPVISSPVASDVDGDGEMEIVVGSWDGYLYVTDSTLRDLPGWPLHSRRGFFASPALADLDADQLVEIVVSAETGHLLALNGDGSTVTGFPVDLGHELWSSPTVVRPAGLLDGGQALAIAVGSSGEMVMLDRRGVSLGGWPQPLRGWADATAATNGEVVVITSLTQGDPSEGWVTAWRLDGDTAPGFPVALDTDSDSSPALVQLDGDGVWWCIFGDDAGYLHVVDLNGKPRLGFPVRSQGPQPGPTPTPHPPGGNVHSIEASPAVADVNGDGRYEIAVGSWDGRMYLWDDAGELLSGWPVGVGDQIISSAALVDLDGDAMADVVVGSKDGNLYGWNARGEPLDGFPYALGAPVFSSPWVGDLDHDGRAEVVVGADNGIHLLSGVGPLGAAPWPMFHQDAANTGCVCP